MTEDVIVEEWPRCDVTGKYCGTPCACDSCKKNREEFEITALTGEALWVVCQPMPTDYEPWGYRSNAERGPDCSCGCRWFHVLEGRAGMDWGICGNPASERAGLLTFEHMGCEDFE